MDEPDPLFTLDKREWRDVIRWVDPTISDEEFERMWADFQEWQRMRRLH